MLKPDAPTRRRIITDKNKMNLDVHKQRRKMLKQGAPTRRRIIPQKMKPRCQTREMKVFSKQMHKGDESILKDVSTKVR
jgi:DNA-directed RNA polymerase subunit M/transcription elongation factor TFIIS